MVLSLRGRLVFSEIGFADHVDAAAGPAFWLRNPQGAEARLLDLTALDFLVAA